MSNTTDPRKLPEERDRILADWHSLVASMTPQECSAVGLRADWDVPALERAPIWAVDDTITDLTIDLADSHPGDQVLDRDLVPHPSGLAFLAHSIEGLAVDSPRPVQYDAILWAPTPDGFDGITAACYRRVDCTRPLTYGEWGLVSPVLVGADRQRWVPILRDLFGNEPDEAERKAVELFANVVADLEPPDGDCRWVPLGRTTWLFGQRLEELGDIIAADATERQRASMREDRARMAALWALADSTGITERRPVDLDRPTRRRAKRAGRTAEVAVVKLRHQGGEHRTDTGRHVGVRFLVRPHWRWQACGPGRSERRLTLVQAHVRGPDGAPFKAPTETVFDVSDG